MATLAAPRCSGLKEPKWTPAVLKVRTGKSVSQICNRGVGRTAFPPKARGSISPCLFELLEAVRPPWLVPASLQPMLPFSHP